MDPSLLIEKIHEHKKKMDELETGVENLKKVYDQFEEEPVEIVKGKRNFMKIVRRLKKSDQFTYGIKYNLEFNPEIIRSAKKSQSNNLDVRSLYRVDEDTAENLLKWEEELPGLGGRIIENEGVAMNLNEHEMMLILIKSNVTLLIRDKPFLKIMKHMFELTYENAPTIDLDKVRKMTK